MYDGEGLGDRDSKLRPRILSELEVVKDIAVGDLLYPCVVRCSLWAAAYASRVGLEDLMVVEGESGEMVFEFAFGSS